MTDGKGKHRRQDPKSRHDKELTVREMRQKAATRAVEAENALRKGGEHTDPLVKPDTQLMQTFAPIVARVGETVGMIKPSVGTALELGAEALKHAAERAAAEAGAKVEQTKQHNQQVREERDLYRYLTADRRERHQPSTAPDHAGPSDRHGPDLDRSSPTPDAPDLDDPDLDGPGL